MDFSSGNGPKSSLNSNERAAVMSNLKQQLDLAHAQEILQHVSEKCFKMCVQKPSSSLSSSEQVYNKELIGLYVSFCENLFNLCLFYSSCVQFLRILLKN